MTNDGAVGPVNPIQLFFSTEENGFKTFDSLPTVTLEEMYGNWNGGEVDTMR
jgi:hypothetical protein